MYLHYWFGGTSYVEISELAMPKSRKVTTVCNGRRKVWTDYEEAKSFFPELMMSTDGEEHERAEWVYIQLLHGLGEYRDKDENLQTTTHWQALSDYTIYNKGK